VPIAFVATFNEKKSPTIKTWKKTFLNSPTKSNTMKVNTQVSYLLRVVDYYELNYIILKLPKETNPINTQVD